MRRPRVGREPCLRAAGGGRPGNLILVGLAVVAMAALAACGLDVQQPDLFLLTRTGQGTKLTLLVNDSGTIRCNGSRPKMLSGTLLIQARDLADSLGKDAQAGLALPAKAGTVFSYRIRMEQGTLRFADRDTSGHSELAQAELFTAQAAQRACGLTG